MPKNEKSRSEYESAICKALEELYLAEEGLEDALSVFPSTHSWHLQEILSDLYSGMSYLEEIVDK